MREHPIHPAADIMPPMSDGDYERLRDDIAANGLIHPLALHGGLLLDGRHRQRACAELGIQPDTTELPDTVEPYGYVVSANVHRRHLAVGQRAIIGARMPRQQRGGDRKSKNQVAKLPLDRTLPARADAVGVSVRSLRSAEHIVDHGEPAIVSSVETDEIKLHDAEAAIKRIAGQTDDPEERAELQRRAHTRVTLTRSADSLCEALDNMAVSDAALDTNLSVGRGDIAMSEAHKDTAMMAQQRRAEIDAEAEERGLEPYQVAAERTYQEMGAPPEDEGPTTREVFGRCLEIAEWPLDEVAEEAAGWRDSGDWDDADEIADRLRKGADGLRRVADAAAGRG